MGDEGSACPFLDIFGISISMIANIQKKTLKIDSKLKIVENLNILTIYLANTFPFIFKAIIGELGALVLTVIVFLKTPIRFVSYLT